MSTEKQPFIPFWTPAAWRPGGTIPTWFKHLLAMALVVAAIVGWIILLEGLSPKVYPNPEHDPRGPLGFIWLTYRLWWIAPAAIALLTALKGIKWELGTAVAFALLLAAECWLFEGGIALCAGTGGTYCKPMGDRAAAVALVAMPSLAALAGHLLRLRRAEVAAAQAASEGSGDAP